MLLCHPTCVCSKRKTKFVSGATRTAQHAEGCQNVGRAATIHHGGGRRTGWYGECFSCTRHCGHEGCRQLCARVLAEVETCVEDFVRRRFINKRGMTTIKSRHCGQDGVAYVVQAGDGTLRVVKAVFCWHVAGHAIRYRNWKLASDKNVGPRLVSGRYCQLRTAHEAVGDVGISLIGMHYWPQCKEADDAHVVNILKLIHRTSKALMLHTDAHYSNIRCGPRRAIFIDWEDVIRVDAWAVAIAEYLMLACMMADSKVAVMFRYRDAMRSLHVDKGAVEAFVSSIENESARETFEMALEQGHAQQDHQTLQEFYRLKHDSPPDDGHHVSLLSSRTRDMIREEG